MKLHRRRKDMIKVFVNGYGTIGKRVADAVSLQRDMEVSGVLKMKPDYIAASAFTKYPLFTLSENVQAFRDAGLVARPMDKGIAESDIIIDCSPGGKGEGESTGVVNKRVYQNLGKKAIFQGGEKADIGISFVAQCNFEKAILADYVRVVSCNTTGLSRTLGALRGFGIERVLATMIRRGPDPADIKTGPVNAIVPETKVPSHHGPDVQTVIDIPIQTFAIIVPTTLMHLHTIAVDFKNDVSRDDVIGAFRKATRVRLVDSKSGIKSTAEVMELARELKRGRSDMYEIVVWEDSVNVKDKTLFYIQAVHQESDVVPENIDAVRAMFNLMGKEQSIAETNRTLGIAF
jgi:glyceraldehyde-3-phosphate dehydrogenase (NAD(P))